jgi:hypothetical protein
MAKVTKIDWTIKTADKWWSGTDTRITCEVLKDNQRLLLANLEPGNTPRLDRSEQATYFWEFQNPTGIGVAVSGTVVPYYIDFAGGISGHLQVRFTANGQDAWEKDWIRSSVYFGELRHVPGTIDSMRWVEDWETFSFGRDVVLSTDSSEGFASLTLLY